MSTATVYRIAEEIEQLSVEGRLVLEERLSELLENQWQTEVAEARKIAKARSIDQCAIDEAVRQVRYGS